MVIFLLDLELLSCFKMTVNCFLTKFPKLKFQYFSNAFLCHLDIVIPSQLQVTNLKKK